MKVVNKVLYEVTPTDLKLLAACPEKFWKGVKIISSRAFCFLMGLKSISLPSTIVEIRDSAFEGCGDLEYVDIPNSVEILGRNIFAGCNKIKKININLSEKLVERSLAEKLGNNFITFCSNNKSFNEEKVIAPAHKTHHKRYAYDDSRDAFELDPDFRPGSDFEL